MEDVVNEFGDKILDSNAVIDRQKLGSIVFADINAMKKLEAIVWPHVQKEIEQRIQKIRSDWLANQLSSQQETDSIEPVVVVEAAVLLDAGWQNAFLDAVWVITVPNDVAMQRIMKTRGLSQEEAMKRIQAQNSRRGIGNMEEEVRNGVVTATIDNSGSLEDLQKSLSSKLSDKSAWYRTEA